MDHKLSMRLRRNKLSLGLVQDSIPSTKKIDLALFNFCHTQTQPVDDYPCYFLSLGRSIQFSLQILRSAINLESSTILSTLNHPQSPASWRTQSNAMQQAILEKGIDYVVLDDTRFERVSAAPWSPVPVPRLPQGRLKEMKDYVVTKSLPLPLLFRNPGTKPPSMLQTTLELTKDGLTIKTGKGISDCVGRVLRLTRCRTKGFQLHRRGCGDVSPASFFGIARCRPRTR